MLEQLLPPDDHHHPGVYWGRLKRFNGSFEWSQVLHTWSRSVKQSSTLAWDGYSVNEYFMWPYHSCISFMYIVYMYVPRFKMFLRVLLTVALISNQGWAGIRCSKFLWSCLSSMFLLARPLADIQSLLSHPHIALSVQYHSIMIKKGYKDRRKDRYNDRHKYRHKDRNKDTKTDH